METYQTNTMMRLAKTLIAPKMDKIRSATLDENQKNLADRYTDEVSDGKF